MILVLYPVFHKRYFEELSFAAIFTGTLVVFVVLPQILQSYSITSGTSAVGDWYVHYMLAAPFAVILDLLGIETTSIGNLVTI